MPNKENPELWQWGQEQQAQDKANQQAISQAKISEKEAEKREKRERSRQTREDLEFLKTSGAIAVFQDAAKILRQQWSDATVAILKPGKDQKGIYLVDNVNIGLFWDFWLNQGGAEPWSYHAIYCKVVKPKEQHSMLQLEYLELNKTYNLVTAYSTVEPEELPNKLTQVITTDPYKDHKDWGQGYKARGYQEPSHLGKRALAFFGFSKLW
ncbi:hypothetical protein HY388_01490 [Candidatus Daviesbacteria bacterium]|nr:hypothetical protein [Candidatus Daviesbacteria bacterium]